MPKWYPQVSNPPPVQSIHQYIRPWTNRCLPSSTLRIPSPSMKKTHGKQASYRGVFVIQNLTPRRMLATHTVENSKWWSWHGSDAFWRRRKKSPNDFEKFWFCMRIASGWLSGAKGEGDGRNFCWPPSRLWVGSSSILCTPRTITTLY